MRKKGYKCSDLTKEKQAKITQANKDKMVMKKRELVEKIKEQSKEMFLPTLKDKINETANYIVDILKQKGDEVSNIQIMSLIARRSMYEIACSNITFTPQEILISFNLYLEMIEKINEITKFPPTVESFSLFIGISHSTYNKWLVDSDKLEVMEYINSYMLGTLSTGGLTGELREISAMFQQKVLGKIEVQAPVVIEHKKEVSIDEINEQLNALKSKKIIEGEIDE
ncbi:MAG: hypothetical protein IJR82_01090 [Bacilli bacterium]|nr:hypothetical protein [Bacilli bacterium]